MSTLPPTFTIKRNEEKVKKKHNEPTFTRSRYMYSFNMIYGYNDMSSLLRMWVCLVFSFSITLFVYPTHTNTRSISWKGLSNRGSLRLISFSQASTTTTYYYNANVTVEVDKSARTLNVHPPFVRFLISYCILAVLFRLCSSHNAFAVVKCMQSRPPCHFA